MIDKKGIEERQKEIQDEITKIQTQMQMAQQKMSELNAEWLMLKGKLELLEEMESEKDEH